MEVPKFQSEEEEAAWWPQQEEAIADDFEAALREGTLLRGGKPIAALTLSAEDAQAARDQAQRRGVEYVSYLEAIVHDALQHERRQAS